MRLLARLAEETIARDAIANGVFVAAASLALRRQHDSSLVTFVIPRLPPAGSRARAVVPAEMALAGRAAACAIVSYVRDHPDRALGPSGDSARDGKRLDLAADLCALVDLGTADAGGVRDACMIDYLPKLTPDGAANLLAGLRRAVGAAVAPLEVFTLGDVVLVANAPRMLRRLVALSSDADDHHTLVDVSAPDARDDARAAHAATLRRVAAAAARLLDRRREPTSSWTEALDDPSFARVPAPTLAGLCLGYPRVYAWYPAEDIAHAARRLSSTDLTLHEVTAVFLGGERRRVCGFTVPADAGSTSPSTTASIREWFREMRARADASEGVWTNARLVVEPRGMGPVAL